MTLEQLQEANSISRELGEYGSIIDKINDLENTQIFSKPTAKFSIQGTEYTFYAVDGEEKEMFYKFLKELKKYYIKKFEEAQAKFNAL